MIFVTGHKPKKFYLFSISTGAGLGRCYPTAESIIKMYWHQLVSTKRGLWSLKCPIPQ